MNPPGFSGENGLGTTDNVNIVYHLEVSATGGGGTREQMRQRAASSPAAFLILFIIIFFFLFPVGDRPVLGAQPESHGPAPETRSNRTPDHFERYYSGPPCPEDTADRTFSQFQVNLTRRLETATGTLAAGAKGEAILRLDDGRHVQLVSNASRVDWLLAYPHLDTEMRVLGRSILASDCTVRNDAFYVEALYPTLLLDETIVPELDLRAINGYPSLQQAVEGMREALADGTAGPDGSAIARLEHALYAEEAASASEPWRALLAGPAEPLHSADSIDVLLSGSDGGAGMFGHIAVGVDGDVYNIYPKGSDRGAPMAVSLGEYLFSAQRGQAMRRPSWVLRIEGLPARMVQEIREAIQRQVDRIDSGERPYHPTRNNCVTACLRSLEPAGIKVSHARYFTRRFPRPVFSKVLSALPRLVDKAGPDRIRIELWFVPQVGIRPLTGRAPNRPMWDRTRPH